MPKRTKTRPTLSDILASCSETLFPAEMGAAPVFLNSHGADGDTPLHVMVWRGDNFGATQLIAAGADVNAAGDMSETPLHVAVKKRNATVVKALLDAGADPDRVSEFDHSPRTLAEEMGADMRRLFGNN